MENKELQNIWNSGQENTESQTRFSISDIRNYRDKYMADTTSSVNRLIIFDTVYKAIVATAYIFFLFSGNHRPAEIVISSLIIVFLLIFMVFNLFLQARGKNMDESMDVMTVLKLKFRFLKKVSNVFLPTSALTNVFFVLAGFRFYMVLKYGRDDLLALLHDPVIYVFLALSFIIPYIVQKVNLSKEINDLESMIDTEVLDMDPDLAMIKRNRRTRQIIFILLLVAGLALLLILRTRLT